MKKVTFALFLALAFSFAQCGCSKAGGSPPAPAKALDPAPHPLAAAGAYVVSAQITGVDPAPPVAAREQNLAGLVGTALSGAGVPIVTPESRKALGDAAVASLVYNEHTWDIAVPGFLPSKGYELAIQVLEAGRLERDQNILVPAVVYGDANFGLSPPEALDQNIGDHRVQLFHKFLDVHRGTRDNPDLRSGSGAAERTNKDLAEALKQPFRCLHGLSNAMVCVIVDPELPGGGRLRAAVLNDLVRKLAEAGVKTSIDNSMAVKDLVKILKRNDAYVEMTVEGFLINSGGDKVDGAISHLGMDVWQQITPITRPEISFPCPTYSDERVGHEFHDLVESNRRVAAEMSDTLVNRILEQRF